MDNIKMVGLNSIERLAMSEADLKRAILGDFASLYISEIQKLIEIHGKQGFMEMLRNDR